MNQSAHKNVMSNEMYNSMMYADDSDDLELHDIMAMHDRAYEHSKITRERAADDLVFYWITNWDESTLGESTLGYKGEFNIIRKAGRQIIGDLRANPVQVNFYQKDEDDNDAGDLMDGIYRASTRENTSVEAFDVAKQEAVVCGLGGWELYTDYDTNKLGDQNQVLRRRPIHEFNNTAFCDPSAMRMDKSDSDYWSVLVPYSKEGMEKLAFELTGENLEIDAETFKWPEHSYTFPWVSGQDEVFYATRFYHRTKVTDYVMSVVGPDGGEQLVLKSTLRGIIDELEADGYTIEQKKEIVRYSVKLYIANGARILKTYEIAGPNLPVVPNYGERAIVEGEEHWEGATRLAKDPQRLRNFQMSYLGDILSRTPRPQPIFTAEQIQGYEDMYRNNGADSYLPYLLQNATNSNGNVLPLGPVGQMPEQPVPQALIQSIEMTREAVGDVAPANVPQDMADIDLSGKALANLQNRLSEQSVVYQQNHKHALRRDAEIAAGMASVIYDTPRNIAVIKNDGTRVNKKIMDNVFDIQTGELKTENDLTGKEFEVFADIGPDYSSKKEETFLQLDPMIDRAVQIDPQIAEMLFLKQIELVDGVNMDDVRKYARNQSILKGFVEPETDEEKQMVQQSMESQQEDPNAALARAEQSKADAQLAEVQRKTLADQFSSQNNQLKTQVNQFDAATRRMAVQIDAQEAEADIEFKRIDAMTNRINTINRN